MVLQNRIATRPTITTECTCLWQEFNDRCATARVSSALPATLRYTTSVTDAVSGGMTGHPLQVMSGTYPDITIAKGLFHNGGISDTEQHERNTPSVALSKPRNGDGSIHHQTRLTRGRQRLMTNVADPKWATHSKVLADRPIPDLLIRRVKKNIRKSSEHKLRELVSYKAELLNSLRALVPKHTEAQLTEQDSFSRSEFGQTWLCKSCLTQLKTYLYYTPVARSTYLYEHSVPSYLSLLDDAIAAVNYNTEMEDITHHELSSILHAELSVIEWRLSLKLARFHKKTGYLGVFPMEVGDYADLEIKRSLNKPEDGILTVIWKKVRRLGGE